jgi:hypothetical protein
MGDTDSSDSDSSCWDDDQFSWDWDIPQDSSFAPGKDIGLLTYREMYEKVTTWHMKVAGEPLCVHGRLPRDSKERKAKPGEAPHIVQFYCSHGRDHGDQSGRISPKQPEAVRASRSNENMRTKFSDCSMRITVKREVGDNDGCAEVRDKLKGHQLHLTNTSKFQWYFDSAQRQASSKCKRTDNQHWAHSGHVKGKLVTGRVTPQVLKFIESLADQNITVPSTHFLHFEGHAYRW